MSNRQQALLDVHWTRRLIPKLDLIVCGIVSVICASLTAAALNFVPIMASLFGQWFPLLEFIGTNALLTILFRRPLIQSRGSHTFWWAVKLVGLNLLIYLPLLSVGEFYAQAPRYPDFWVMMYLVVVFGGFWALLLSPLLILMATGTILALRYVARLIGTVDALNAGG